MQDPIDTKKLLLCGSPSCNYVHKREDRVLDKKLKLAYLCPKCGCRFYY